MGNRMVLLKFTLTVNFKFLFCKWEFFVILDSVKAANFMFKCAFYELFQVIFQVNLNSISAKGVKRSYLRQALKKVPPRCNNR